jgi:hypothetical protein
MGSYITLAAEGLELDWGKDELFQNHSRLFARGDIKEVPYHYADGDVDTKKAFCRRLGDTKRRLELLGYSLPAIRGWFVLNKAQVESDFPDLGTDPWTVATMIQSLELAEIKPSSRGKYASVSQCVRDSISRDRQINGVGSHAGTVSADDSDFFDHLHPYVILRLLIENPGNLDAELCWRYSDVVEGGYASEIDLYEDIGQEEKFLVVTEGSSDLFIIERALQILRPDIVDFFSFVDTTENYPFTGTSNLYRFSQGLVSIGILNKVLIVYDNDTAGCDAYDRTRKLNLPANMGVTKLPERSEFMNFLTLGPSGQNREDINGRAVGIEHFLDLKYGAIAEPAVRWTAFDDKVQAYQGSLVGKEEYVRRLKEVDRRVEGYDFSKLESLLDFLYEQCTSIAVRCASGGRSGASMWYSWL